MRPKTIIAATALMTLVTMQYEAAASAQIVALKCKGMETRTTDCSSCTGKPDKEPITNTGIVVNLADGTVSITVSGWSVAARITTVDDAHIAFSDTSPVAPAWTITVSGHIDRVTGQATVTAVAVDPKVDVKRRITDTWRDDLTCKATNRQF